MVAERKYGDEVREEARRLRAEGVSWRLLSERLGVPRGTLREWGKAWEAEERPSDEPGGGAAPPPEPGGEGRKHERAPRPEPGARRLPPPPSPAGPPELDLGAIHGYIEGAYKLAGKLAAERGDEVLSDTLVAHAPAAATAWRHYIESEPRVQEMLRRLMVGTPVGELVAVHASMVFSYTLARSAAKEMAARAAQEEAARAAAAAGPHGDGGGHAPIFTVPTAEPGPSL